MAVPCIVLEAMVTSTSAIVFEPCRTKLSAATDFECTLAC